jgi:hypothetical protein
VNFVLFEIPLAHLPQTLLASPLEIIRIGDALIFILQFGYLLAIETIMPLQARNESRIIPSKLAGSRAEETGAKLALREQQKGVPRLVWIGAARSQPMRKASGKWFYHTSPLSGLLSD